MIENVELQFQRINKKKNKKKCTDNLVSTRGFTNIFHLAPVLHREQCYHNMFVLNHLDMNNIEKSYPVCGPFLQPTKHSGRGQDLANNFY